EAADPSSRTFEARYVLEGEAASAPLGSTVTIELLAKQDSGNQSVMLPVGAIYDRGNGPGVWIVDGKSEVKFRPITIASIGRVEDPSFTIKVLTVTSVWPGATAQEMQDLVAEPLEKRLQELRWYDRVETITRPGLALMTLQLIDKTPPKEVAEQFYQARKKL